MTDRVRLEPAQPEDAAAVLHIHCAAVRQTAAPFYSQEIINSWARLPIEPERVERVKKGWIENSDRRMIVAKKNDEVIGYGLIDSTGELLGLFVHPDHGRQGIGARILARLEQVSLAWGISVLRADAAINAEAFYGKQGFEVVEYSTHRLSSGLEMACVKMRKILAS